MSTIQHIDELILKMVNIHCANTVLDTLTVLWRNPYFWAPVYLFLLVWIAFFDRFDLYSQLDTRKKLKQLDTYILFLLLYH